jgi:hypothetical protein
MLVSQVGGTNQPLPQHIRPKLTRCRMAFFRLALGRIGVRSDLPQIPARALNPAGKYPREHGEGFQVLIRCRDVPRDG